MFHFRRWQFLPDANEVMQLLLKAQTEMGDIEVDDPQVRLIIRFIIF